MRLEKKVGQRIVELRRKQGLTSEQLAWESGVSKSHVNDIENGKRLPSLRVLEKLARALKVELKDFF